MSADNVTTNSSGNQVFVGDLVVGGTFDFTASESGSVINVTNLSGGGTLNGSTNNGSVTIEANTGDLAVQSVDAGTGDLSLTSTAGSITDSDTSSDASANLIAAQITLESANGIGASGSGDLDTTASTLVSSVTGSGNIFITDKRGSKRRGHFNGLRRYYHRNLRWDPYGFRDREFKFRQPCPDR